MTQGQTRAPVVDASGSVYSVELADRICDFIIEGVPVSAICRMDGMPSQSTVYKWLRYNEEFAQKYWQARKCSVERLADEMLAIADDGKNDYMERVRRDGEVEVVADHEHMQRSALRISTRKFLLSRLSPERWGEKVKVNVDDGAAVLVIKGRDKSDGDTDGGSGGAG